MSGAAERTGCVVLDAGNTKTRVAVWRDDPCGAQLWQGGEELGVLPTPTTTDPSPAAGVAALAAGTPTLPSVLVSVSPAATERLRERLPALAVVDHTWDLPFRCDVEAPERVGADRLCNMAAAAALGRDAVLVVDAGTATTFDLLLAGAFVGGFIAPGMALAAEALGERAARLAPVPFASAPFAPGRNTHDAMQRGAFHVGVHGVAGVIEAFSARYPDLHVVLTGGCGRYVATAEQPWDPLWTLRGAAVLWRRRTA
ncbi:type III pantothenate kinase [bacterium]|nr:type III pantothenate kinase [bacterium]